MKSPAARAFWTHGSVCATHPCEVLFIIITLTLTMISFVDWHKDPSPKYVHPDYHGIDVVFMTVVRCGALLYTYHQFQNLSHPGSRYLFGIAGLIVVFSSLVFCCTVLKILDSDITDLKDAVFFFLLLIDLNKAKFLAQFAFESLSYKEVQENIAEGLSLLGPSLTLDTIAEALLIGAGTLSGVSRVEQMCGYAVLSIIVNYIILITFYPSCLSLILELSHRCSSSKPPWQMMRQDDIQKVEATKSNPILQGVKIIMSAGLFLVHGITRWSFDPERLCISMIELNTGENRNASSEPPFIVRWLNAGLDHAVLMVILVVLLIKYSFFETFWPLQDKTQVSNKDRHSSTPEKGEMNKKPPSHICTTQSAVDAVTQTEDAEADHMNEPETSSQLPRTLEECHSIAQTQDGFSLLTDSEILRLIDSNLVPQRTLEKKLKDCLRAVSIRRSFISGKIPDKEALANLPFQNYNYEKVQGACCENVIGYVQVPVGVAGPLRVNGMEYMIPLATTEGALVASTSRGCKAISASEAGAKSFVFKDAMSRAPVIELPSAEKACEVRQWIRRKFNVLAEAFDATSSVARLIDIHPVIASRLLYIRFEATCGDAMGMNMVSRGTEAAICTLKRVFPELREVSISGNLCTDKKPAAVNWILGRGKSVVCDAVIPATVVKSVLKTTTARLVDLNVKKNHIGSSLAGSIGGNNAHAANIIAALFIACGQDPAQVVESSSCMTVMEKEGPEGEDLYVSVTMPCLEVGTVGGGTRLPPQAACLHMLGVKGPSKDSSGEHAKRLAMIAAAAVMAGEISLVASLAEQTLVQSHMRMNRVPLSTPSATAPVSGSTSS